MKTASNHSTVVKSKQKEIIPNLLEQWEEYQKTGKLDVEGFARQFVSLLKQGVTLSGKKGTALRGLLDHWGDIFQQSETRRAILQELSLATAEQFVRQINQQFRRLKRLDFYTLQRWSGEILFAFKHSDWRQKVYQAEQTERWFELYLSLIETARFNVGALLQTWSRHYQDEIAFQYTIAERTFHLGWEEMWERILRIGNALRKLSDESGQELRVAILSENRIEGVLVDLACLTFGIVNVMVPANASTEDMVYIIEDSEVNTLFVSKESILNNLLPHISHLEHLKKVILFERTSRQRNQKIISYRDFLRDSSVPENEMLNSLLAEIEPDRLATIMYTSGTTGKPKGIMFSHRNIVSKRFARALAWPDVNEEDIFLAYLPLYHTFGRWLEMLGSLFWGATYIFARSPSLNSLLREMQLYHPTIFISIPQKWQQIYDYVANQVNLNLANDEQIRQTLGYHTGGKLRLGLSAAGYLDPDIFKFFQRNGIELMSGFGMTEATGGITMTPPGKYRSNSLGTALPGIELKLAEDGELLIRGPYVMMGYWKAEKESFDEAGWFHTGDIMRMDRDGYLFIIDRKKEIYKNVKGQTVAPQRIENFFRDIDAIKRVFLVGDQREYNTLLIYPNYDHQEVNLKELSREELRDFLASIVNSVNQFLAPYERIVDFAVIDRDFSPEKGELTPKRTYRRKVIVEHFRDVIEKMYQSNFVELQFRDTSLRFPNWLLRELGVLANEVQISPDDKLLIQGIPIVELEANEHDPFVIRIGNLWYRFFKKPIDLGEILSHPRLWLTNQELVDLTHEKIFDWQRFKQEVVNVRVEFEGVPKCKNPNLAWEAFRLIKESHIHNLRGLHFSGLILQTGDAVQALQAVDYLAELVRNPLDPLQPLAIQTLTWAAQNPHKEVKQRAFLTLFKHLPETNWIEVFRHFLESDATFFDDMVVRELCEWNFSDTIFNQILDLAETVIKRDALPGEQPLSEQSGVLIRFLQRIATARPTKYRAIRRFFTTYRVEHVNTRLREMMNHAIARMEADFREWLGSNSPVAIDPDLGREYSWREVIVFDDNVPDQHIYLLQELISKTPFIREALFLFTNHLIVNLKDLPPGGIWITTLGEHHGKSVYRISVQTRYQGRYDITANVITGMTEQQIMEEISWSIICSEKPPQPKLVEEFGGYWPEYRTWSEEFIPGETVAAFYHRITRQKNEEKIQRLAHLWPYIIWSSCKAYVDFWNRTGRRFEVADPSPENIIVPHHDYQTGTRIISISARRRHKNLAEAVQNFYHHFIDPMVDKYPFLREKTKWQFVFSPILEILGEEEGLQKIEEMLSDSHDSQFGKDFKKAARIYLESIKQHGFMPKQLYFAIKRFERWKQVNPEATTEADAATVHELYDTYALPGLEDRYPETRVRFYRETVFRDANPELRQHLDQLIQLLKHRKLRGDDLVQYISNLQASLKLSEAEKYLLTRMGYAHLRPSDMAELMTMDTGEKTTAALVVTFLDREGEQIRVRNPINPKEVAALHRMFHQSNLPVSFQPHDQFLLAFNQRDQLVGGLFYHVHGSETVHLEKIVVADHYRRKWVSGGLLKEFFNRMRSLGYKRVRTGFFRPEFFYRFGFRIEKGFPGLVKNLTTEEK